MGGEGRREEENEVRRKDGEKKRDSRQRNNMQCIPTTNRECIWCQYHYTKQTLTMATEPSLDDWNVYMIPMFTQKGCTLTCNQVKFIVGKLELVESNAYHGTNLLQVG